MPAFEDLEARLAALRPTPNAAPGQTNEKKSNSLSIDDEMMSKLRLLGIDPRNLSDMDSGHDSEVRSRLVTTAPRPTNNPRSSDTSPQTTGAPKPPSLIGSPPRLRITTTSTAVSSHPPHMIWTRLPRRFELPCLACPTAMQPCARVTGNCSL